MSWFTKDGDTRIKVVTKGTGETRYIPEAYMVRPFERGWVALSHWRATLKAAQFEVDTYYTDFAKAELHKVVTTEYIKYP